MARKYSTAMRDGWNAKYEEVIGASPVLKLWTGAEPANCAGANSGTLLAALNLPADFQGNSASGVTAKAGTWAGTCIANGTVGHYRLESAGGTVHEQGSVGTSGADLNMTDITLEIGQPVSINTWSRTAPGA